MLILLLNQLTNCLCYQLLGGARPASMSSANNIYTATLTATAAATTITTTIAITATTPTHVATETAIIITTIHTAAALVAITHPMTITTAITF